LEHYPDGNFAEIARMRMAKLARPAPMKLVAGATAVVVLVGGVFGLITEWPKVREVVAPPPSPEPATSDTTSAPQPELGEPAASDAAPARPEDLPDLDTFTDTLADGSPCGFCPEMIVIPAGTFTMGSPPEEKGRNEDEGPQREVRVQRFALGRTEVTFAQYDACVDAGGCGHSPFDWGWGRGDRPVMNVSWNDAQAYTEWLSVVTGEPYRLPSEAEWEYTARAGTTTLFAFGDGLSPSQANFDGNVGRTWQVGTGAANDWGLFDMHGNVWEWVEDCWHDGYRGAPQHGSPWLEAKWGDCSRRIIRGGAWDDRAGGLRSAVRIGKDRVDRDYSVGFRVARTLTP
jgi:formylglycine-generating enzyme required for sulfatase activity